MPRTVRRYDCSVFLHSVYNFSDYAHFMMSKYYNFVQFAINMIRFISKRHFISQQRQWRSQQLRKKNYTHAEQFIRIAKCKELCNT